MGDLQHLEHFILTKVAKTSVPTQNSSADWEISNGGRRVETPSSAQKYAGRTCQHSKEAFLRMSAEITFCPVASAALANCLIQATRRKIFQVVALIWWKRNPRRRRSDDQETEENKLFRLEPRLSTDRRQLRLRRLLLSIMTCVLSARRAADQQIPPRSCSSAGEVF
jgi:hypothetical protein